MLGVKRREFIALIGGTAAAWPLAARGEGARKPPLVGILAAGSESTWGNFASSFVQRLRELGWTEGSTVAFQYRWGDGRTERFSEIAEELVRLRVDMIMTGATLPVVAAKRATSTIPIVFAAVGNPVEAGLVDSLARPGGNVTGVSNQNADLGGKRVELLSEIVPGLRRLAILGNIASASVAAEMAQAQAAGAALGLEVISSEIRRAEDIAPALQSLNARSDGLYVAMDPLVSSNRARISTLALEARLPTMHGARDMVEAGGLISYGTNLADLFRRAADLADKILRGTKPADIPVEQPTKFDLVINLATAKTLGLTIPEAFLLRANEVIE
jgi:putative ABC transport system substrate-binding protein